MLCFLDTEAAPVFSLKIPLFTPSNTSRMESDHLSEQSVSPSYSEATNGESVCCW
jgi:hypothetical protein